ncbi:MAG: AsmA-like C-terminal domain-containing protein, partial [Deltaproteobacteria bacterium]|nr:AsmA-like C-terminal domain-containing protein [Deltaproteobacteria bacterium]
RTRVDVLEFNLNAKYQRVPYPLKIRQGRLYYSATEIDLSGMEGELGGFSFSDLAVRIDWSREPHLTVQSGEFRLFLDEIHPWLSSFEALPFIHSLKDTGINGTLLFSNLNLRGPLQSPKDWLVLASGKLREFVFDSNLFPGPIKVSDGDFNILEDTIRQELHFQETQISMLDTFLTVSGYLDDYRKGLDLAEINLKGDVNLEGTRWFSNLLHVPNEFMIRSPISVSESRFIWEKGVRTCFKGDLLLQSGPRISVDILKEPKSFVLKNLHVQDKDSQLSAKLILGTDTFSINFTGNVSEASIHRVFVRELPYLSELQGDFKANILFDQPKRSTTQGKLTGKDLIFPWGLKVPLRIGSFAIYGQEDQIKVDSAVCTWGECHGVLNGTLNFTETEYVFNMDFSSDALILDKLKRLFAVDPRDKETNRLWNAPVCGTIKLNLGTFIYDERFTWTPFHADISFHPEKVMVSVTNAELCGISTPGTLEWTTEGVSFDFRPIAERQEVDPTVKCLREGKVRATGLFDLKGHIMAKGKAEHLSESVQGKLEAFAKDGRIHHSIPLEKVFAYLSVIEIFRGQLPKMTEEGLAYKSITIRGDFQEGKFMLKEGVLDGLSMNMAAEGYYDLKNKKIKGALLVAPLKTADSVINKIPGINHIMAGTLVSIPVKIEGELSDPVVKVLPASSVGEGLWGMMKRTVELPFIILDSIFSNNGKNPEIDRE